MKLLSPLILAFCFSTAFAQTPKPTPDPTADPLSVLKELVERLELSNAKAQKELDDMLEQDWAIRESRRATTLSTQVATSRVARTPTVVSDKNINDCFKRSSKSPAAFDLCVKYEFDRIREEKKLAELRANDPPGTVYPCDYSKTTVKNLQKCFDSLMVKLSQAPERTSSTSGYSTSAYLPTWRDFPRYRYSSYYPSRWYPSYLYPRTYNPYRYTRRYPSRTYRRY